MKKTGSEDSLKTEWKPVLRYRHTTKCCQLFEELLTEKSQRAQLQKQFKIPEERIKVEEFTGY
jgi:hypothetical protein